jgi:hypothetical protein
MQTAYNKPVRVEGELTQIDRKGSYTGIYTTFDGIPQGKPKIFYTNIPTTADFYYVKLDILTFASRHVIDPFPILTVTGAHYLDKNLFEFIEKHYCITYNNVSGYYFDEGFNTSLKSVALTLFNERERQKANNNSQLSQTYKTLLNSMWGKSIQNKNPTYTVQIEKDRFEGFKEYNHKFLVQYNKNKHNDNIFDCRLIKPLLINYIRPQFGINILSYSKTLMANIIYTAIDNDIDIYYSNTDSLCLQLKDMDKLNNLFDNQLLGNQLGQFATELSAHSYKFIGISSCKYIHCLTNGEYKARYQKQPKGDLVEMFENLYNKLT